MFQYNCFVVFFALFYGQADSCSCYPRHPQEIFCSPNTDFVIKAVVVSGKHIYQQNHSVAEKHFFGLAYYSTYITKIFKGHDALKTIFTPKNKSENFNPRRQKAILYTAATSGTCGVFLKPGTKYLLSGMITNSKIMVAMCDLVVPFGELTRQQRAGIRGAYDCRCKLKRCPVGQVCERSSDTCEWDVKHSIGIKEIKCDMKHRACKKLGNRCLWLEDQKYETCVVKQILKSAFKHKQLNN